VLANLAYPVLVRAGALNPHFARGFVAEMQVDLFQRDCAAPSWNSNGIISKFKQIVPIDISPMSPSSLLATGIPIINPGIRSVSS
jgi:hypothetical protein